MIEIILEDLIGSTDVAGVEIVMSSLQVVLVSISSGTGSTSTDSQGAGSRSRSNSASYALSRLLSGLELRQVLSAAANNKSLRSHSAASRAVVSSGSASRFETGTLRS